MRVLFDDGIIAKSLIATLPPTSPELLSYLHLSSVNFPLVAEP